MSDTPRLTHVYSYTHDLEATRAFYEGLLGLSVSIQFDRMVEFNAGTPLVFLLADGDAPAAPPAFSSFPGWPAPAAENQTAPQRALCSLRVDKEQLDAIHARLAAAGAQFTLPELRDGAWELRALDPMGNTVELYAVELT